MNIAVSNRDELEDPFAFINKFKLTNRKFSASANSQSETFVEKVERIFEIIESFLRKLRLFLRKLRLF